MGFFGGFAQGLTDAQDRQARAKAEKFNEAYQSRQQDIDETRAKTADATAQTTLAAAQKQAAIDAQNQQFEANLRLPPNWGKMDTAAKRAYLEVRQTKAQQNHDDTIFNETQQQIAALNVEDKTADAHTLDMARVHDLQVTRPQEFNEKLAESYAAVNAGLEKANIGASSRAYVANLGASSRMQVAQLHAAAMLDGDDDNNAWRAAIASFQQQNMNARTNAEDDTKVIDSTGGAGGLPPQVGGNTTVVVPDEASGTARLIEQIRALTGNKSGLGGLGGGGQNPIPKMPPLTPDMVRGAVQQGGAAATKAGLMKNYGLTSAQADSWIRSVSGSNGSSIKPPPINGVGSF